MTAAANGAGLPSLRARLVRHVMLPLSVAWSLGSLLLAGIAIHFAGTAFDRSLLDDAYSLASHVVESQGRLQLDLSSREVQTLLFDQSESVFFSVWDAQGRLVAGHGGVRPVAHPQLRTAEFSDTVFNGRELRSVTLRQDHLSGFQVVMAQTRQDRDKLLNRLLVYSLLPQMLLLVLLTAWLWRRIAADLGPLQALQQALDARAVTDLAPIAQPADVLEIDHLKRAVNGLLQRIGHSLQAQREFTGNVAHELRTPLAGIRALAEYALASKDAAVWRQQLQKIAHSEQRVSHLVDQLLALALADEAAAAFSLVPVALDDLVRRAVIDCLPRADAAGVDLGAQGLERPVQVMGHPALIEGVLTNLVDNALRHAVRRDGTPAVVTVALELAGPEVVLSVTDNGPGLAPAEREALVQRWAQGAGGQADTRGGVGLGLAIVSKYAQLLHADFRLAAAPDGPGLAAQLVLRRA